MKREKAVSSEVLKRKLSHITRLHIDGSMTKGEYENEAA